MQSWAATTSTTPTNAPPPPFSAQVKKDLCSPKMPSEETRQAKLNLESALKILNLQILKVQNKQITAKGRLARALTKHMNQLEMFQHCLDAISSELHTDCPHTSSAAIGAVSRIAGQIHHELHSTRELGVDDHHNHDPECHAHPKSELLEARILAMPMMKTIHDHTTRISKALVDTQNMFTESKHVSAEIMDFSLAAKMAMASSATRAKAEEEAVRIVSKTVKEELSKDLAGVSPTVEAGSMEAAIRERLGKIHAMAFEMQTKGRGYIVDTYNNQILPQITKWHDHLHSLRENCMNSMMTRFGKSQATMDTLAKSEAPEASVETLATELKSAMQAIADGSDEAVNAKLSQVDQIARLTSIISKTVESSLADNMSVLARESENLKLLEKTIREAAAGKPSALHAVKELLGNEAFSNVLSQLDTLHDGLSPELQAQFVTSWIGDAIDLVHTATREFNTTLGIPNKKGPDTAYLV